MESSQELKPIFSVSEFLEYINLAIGRRRVLVEGEISSFSVNHGKWAFFDLKDQESKVSCFALAYNLGTPLEDGMHVQVTGVPRVYSKSGKFSIMVDRVELKGVGALKRAFELTKAKLEKEGLFDSARKRPMPSLPHSIGLICSRESAAYTDFMRILNQRMGGLTIHLAHVHVQGEQAVKEIAGAFEWFNQNGPELGVEVVALVRGGGSLEDLQAFNSEPVARAVFGSRYPVVCGVGHERDESLADFVADVRAATPTHAAGLIVPDRAELSDRIDGFLRTMNHALRNSFEWYGQKIDANMLSLQHSILGHTHHFSHVVRQFGYAFSSFESRVGLLREASARMTGQVESHIQQRLTRADTAVLALSRTLESFNPSSVLKRGYSIVKRKGQVISSKQSVNPKEKLDITFSDGSISATVDSPQGKLL